MELAPFGTMSVKSLQNVHSVREFVENSLGNSASMRSIESESPLSCGFVALIEIKQRFIRIFCV